MFSRAVPPERAQIRLKHYYTPSPGNKKMSESEMRPSAESPRARGRGREPQRAQQREPKKAPGIRKNPRVSEGAWSFLLLGEGV